MINLFDLVNVVYILKNYLIIHFITLDSLIYNISDGNRF